MKNYLKNNGLNILKYCLGICISIVVIILVDTTILNYKYLPITLLTITGVTWMSLLNVLYWTCKDCKHKTDNV